MNAFIESIPAWLIVTLIVWDSVWKAVTMWKSARRNQLPWFVCLAIFNTVGLLPIVYLLLNSGKKGNSAE